MIVQDLKALHKYLNQELKIEHFFESFLYSVMMGFNYAFLGVNGVTRLRFMAHPNLYQGKNPMRSMQCIVQSLHFSIFLK